MISFSRLLLGQEHYGDSLRYHHSAKGHTRGAAQGLGPVVVWNCTRACNLACRHCYAGATPQAAQQELSTEEAKTLLDSLAAADVPVLLVSGGEPLLRSDLFELLEHAAAIGLRTVISTNGTLITPAIAHRIKALGVSYVGISLDGLHEVNDAFRGKAGAYDQTLSGFRNCHAVGQKTGLRLSLSRTTFRELLRIFDLIEQERIQRVCFYHLVYSGRGEAMKGEDLTPQETRATLDYVIEKTLDFGRRNIATEILTVDNHCDGVYLYEYMKQRDQAKAEEIKRLLSRGGGNRSGMAIGAVDWEGHVYIDQFTRSLPLGNIRERAFGEIWQGADSELLAKLRNRKSHLNGRCRHCRHIALCNGNFRARALSTGDLWASDPACYFTDDEIGLGGSPC